MDAEYTIESRVIGGQEMQVRVYPAGAGMAAPMSAGEVYWARVRLRQLLWERKRAVALARLGVLSSPTDVGSESGSKTTREATDE